jgi:hypothetical protein
VVPEDLRPRLEGIEATLGDALHSDPAALARALNLDPADAGRILLAAIGFGAPGGVPGPSGGRSARVTSQQPPEPTRETE